MGEILKIKVDFDGEPTSSLLNFITNTQEGKFTAKKPVLPNITYRRIEIQEQDKVHSLENFQDEVILYGVSY